jgi:hypothetical protein
MQFFFISAIFINAISALALPGLGSHIENARERNSFLRVGKYFDASVSNLIKAKEEIHILEDYLVARQKIEGIAIQRVEQKGDHAKAQQMTLRKERKANEFNAQVTEWKVKLGMQ